MGGPELSAWLDHEGKRGTPCRDHAAVFQFEGERKNAMSTGDHVAADGTTETEWKAARNSACGCSKNDRRKGSRGRGVVDFIEVLALPVPSESCGHPEQPVDLCVLTDRTIVIAFYRSVPLHGGVAISENQGAIRVFPITHHGCATNNSSYSSEESWLVAKGLPVVTGVAAGGGRGIYFSLCGAGRDGAVTAIGSLSTARVPPVLPRATGIGANHRGIIQAGHCKGDALASVGIAARGGTRIGGKSGGCGEKFARVVSGFAAAVTVDEDMNL